jgi:hypothetical protein
MDVPTCVRDFGQNMFTGTIPSAIGRHVLLNYLGLDANDLSGTIPTEIGLLTLLVTLYLDNNRFTGSLPTEMLVCMFHCVICVVSN